jgi:hypothetical protein
VVSPEREALPERRASARRALLVELAGQREPPPEEHLERQESPCRAPRAPVHLALLESERPERRASEPLGPLGSERRGSERPESERPEHREYEPPAPLERECPAPLEREPPAPLERECPGRRVAYRGWEQPEHRERPEWVGPPEWPPRAASAEAKV